MKQNIHFSLLFVVFTSVLSFSQTTYYLGVGQPTDPQASSCASCHASGGIGQPVYEEWKNTRHAVAQDSVSSSYFGYDCLGCHNTGWDFAQNNYGADEYVLKDTSANPNYVITDPVNFNRVKNVQCEACHGPLGTSERVLDNSHWGFWSGTTNLPNFTAEMCGTCHDGEHHPFYTEWNMSAHASGPPPFMRNRATNGECFYCHFAEDFVAFLDDPNYNGVTFQATKNDAELDVLTCVTCHDPHANNNPGQLRTPISGQQVICDVCHTVQEDSVNVDDTPHHSTSEALSGAPNFGYQYEGKTYQNSAHTYAALERCIDCHVHPTPFNAQTGTAFTGHTFEPRVQACVRCHADYYAVVDTSNAETRFDYRGTQSKTDSLINTLQAKLNQATSADSATIEFKRAKYNLLSAQAEGSTGIHNTRLVQELLRDAISRFNPTGVEIGEGVPTQYGLSQNYPNPFNPSTEIKFSLPEASNVKLIIYDAIGKEVAVIVSDYYSAGNYKIKWNAGNYASGIYFYKIDANNFQMVKKMVLVK
ncbi:MAG: hypothetical protein AUK34_04115 [Ignavibacteria bacterium CG2_30_36_16]|nr:ammonia-forming cytochrome c nitrite reductase subunit c552 [Ignavibacteria bacterium]OIP61912.1 MAG: hypothetical protein AUK34_04115 [Ignavibacteria bacterium CG2_30_36_16]